jgi:hypothetical protein
MSDYRTHQTLQSYFDATMHFNLREKDVTNVQRKGSVVIISTKEKAYLKTVTRR